MKTTGSLIGPLILGLSVLSCFDPPEYPVIPEIEFKGVKFQDLTDPSQQDSLIIELFFKDGDGNLGLDPDENGCYEIDGQNVCFNDKFYFQFDSGPYAGEYLTYKIKRTDPNYSSFPNFEAPFSCTNWEVVPKGNTVDTLYIELNPDYNNIFVEFLVKNNDGSFAVYDWNEIFKYPLCEVQGFNGRFPVLSKNPNVKNPLEGVIRYGMTSVGFNLVFSIKTLKLRVTIQDRMLNKSNTIETPEFTLQSIKG